MLAFGRRFLTILISSSTICSSVALALLPASAIAQGQDDSFLPQFSLSAAQARSAQQCAAHVDQAGNHDCQPPTAFWWAVLTLPCGTLGSAWLDIQPSGDHGAAGLTPEEVAELKNYSALASDGCFAAPKQ